MIQILELRLQKSNAFSIRPFCLNHIGVLYDIYVYLKRPLCPTLERQMDNLLDPTINDDFDSC